MERKIDLDLKKWKNEEKRKPLLIYGIKQIGKTYSAISFGEKEYKKIAYINSENNNDLINVVLKENNVEGIISKLSLLVGETILKKDTLVIIDNVLDERIVKAIKKFGKDEYDYHIIMITSAREKLNIFKGEELQYKYMTAMDFEEFLLAKDKKNIVDAIKKSYKSGRSMKLHEEALALYDEFILTGGYPEVINASLNNESDNRFTMIQTKIWDTYKKELLNMDSLIDITRANDVLNVLPYQLLKSNRKFQYGLMKSGGRSKDYETSIAHLSNNGIIYRCNKLLEVRAPLSQHKDMESFKLYLNDTGLLFMMMHLNKQKIDNDYNLKYILYENSVAVAIMNAGYSLYYYQSEGKAEVPFIIQTRAGKLIPVEVVNKTITKAKALSLFMSKYNVEEAIKFTEENFSRKKIVKYIPFYASFCLKDNL